MQFAVDNQSRERFLDAFEQRAAQGADAVFALVADGGKGPLRLVGDFDLVAESVGTGEQPLEFQVDDPLHVREVERAEDDDVVDAVQELRCEGFFQRPAVFRLRGFLLGVRFRTGAVPDLRGAYCRGPRSDVGGENDYRISEIDLAPRTVGEVSLVKICNRVLKTSGWAFSISSNRTTE